MIEWWIFWILLAFVIICLVLYTLSVMPVTLGEKFGGDYFERCVTYRRISFVFFILMIACYIAYFFIPTPITIPFTLDYKISLITGIVLFVIGGSIAVKGEIDLGKETIRPYKNTVLVTKGIYQCIRHPQTIGESIMLFGLTLLIGSLFLILFSLLAIPAFGIVIYFEEKDLVKRFGDQYIAYKKQVGIFFPKRRN
ncbi:MAG: isoprenylcysteine carboxylmethyltransferase family protein [archaeon]|nr:isoprenylcysteine carboxylmethyltransferase family protein [archaeon]MCP8306554.1 isoprenylcysteine carboxylmethyltransferase family protein [archaeon]